MSLQELAAIEAPFGAAYLLALGAVAVGVIPLDRKRLRIARNCFIASALIFAGIGIMWGISTELPFWPRAIAVFLIVGLAGAASVETVRFLHEQKAPEASLVNKNSEIPSRSDKISDATPHTTSTSPYADNDKGQWSGEKFIFYEPKNVFTVEVTAADNGKQIPFKVNLPPKASVDLSIKIDPLIFDNRNVQARFGVKDAHMPWDGIARHSMLAFVPNDQTFYLETLKPTKSNSSVIKVYMNAWWPPKD